MLLTREEILLEYTKCVKDPIYAIETYFQTFDKTQGGIVPFYLFPRQKEIIYAYTTHRFNLIAKPRQAGVSTTTAAYAAIRVSFASRLNPEKILILANKEKLAMEFLIKIKDFIEQVPRWVWGSEYYGTPQKELKSIYVSATKTELVLPNGSKVKALATSPDALRGYTPTFLIMDEAAYIDRGAEVFGAAMTAMSTGGDVSLISTPNGLDPLYYKTYELARARKNTFNIVEMRWYEDSRYNKDLRWIKKGGVDEATNKKIPDEEIDEVEFTLESYERMIKAGYKPTSTWYEDMCGAMNHDPKMIAQELDVSFHGSGGNVIHDDIIQYHEQNNVQDPIIYEGESEDVWIWQEPVVGHEYIMGVDVSRGDGEDSSTIVIVDVTTMEEVLEYKAHIAPDLLAEIVYEYGMRYQAYTVVDITGGHGVPTVLKLLEFTYKLLHYDKIGNERIFNIQHKKIKASAKDNRIPGFTMNSVRVPLVKNLEMKLRLNLIKVRSRRLVDEMKTFVYKSNGKADHMDGYHDDLLMALGMVLWVYEHTFLEVKSLSAQVHGMLGHWGTSSPVRRVVTPIPSAETQTTVSKPKGSNYWPTPGGSKQAGPPKPANTHNSQYLWLLSGYK